MGYSAHSHRSLSEGDWRGARGHSEDFLAAGVEDVDQQRVHVQGDAAERGHAVHGQNAFVSEDKKRRDKKRGVFNLQFRSHDN